MQQTVKPHIIVVDNGSTDGSLELVEAAYTEAAVIRHEVNKGFAGGVNAGIKAALKQDYEYIALLNNDAYADKNWLKNLVGAVSKDPGAGIVASKMIRSDRKHIDSAGEEYSIWGMPFPTGRNKLDNGQYNTAKEIFGASGGASLYRVKMLKEIGLFDEEFFAYYEDVDVSFRAQLAGWKVLYEPTATVYHEVSATSSKLGSFTRYHATKNFYLLYAKNMPGWLYWKYLPLFTLQALRLAMSSLLKGGGWTYLKGFTRVVLLTSHIIRERKKIQSIRKVDTKYIDSLLYKGRQPKIPPISSE